MEARKALADIGLSIEEAEKNPGLVVKIFRERMVYEDQQTGKRKHWTQDDLARMVGLTKVQVCNMENHNEGLDSIERRKTLATILKIPPVLLGLASLDDIVEIVTGQEKLANKAKRTKVTRFDIQKYQDMFKTYDTLFAEGSTYANVAAIANTTKRIQADLAYVKPEDKDALLRVLWNFQILCEKVYSSDFLNHTKALMYGENAIEIAMNLDDSDLQAASFYHSGVTRLRQGRLGLVKCDIDSALMYARGALPQTKGIIYSLSAHYHLLTSSTMLTQKMLDEAEKCAGAKSGLKTVKFGKGSYFVHRADMLADLGRPAKALEYTDEAERLINPSKKRLLVYLDILRAKCYIEMKRPEYEQAVCILESAITDSGNIYVERNIRFIEDLYSTLRKSSYGNSPEVIDLGLKIRELRRKKNS